MAKKVSKNRESTTITTRIDVDAKTIIKRSGISYRKILEERAYLQIKDNNTQLTLVSKEDLIELKEDIKEIQQLLNENNNLIAQYQSNLQKAQKRSNMLKSILERKESKLDELNNSIDSLEKLKVEYTDKIAYGLEDAVNKVEELLEHNARLRESGPRARVKESEIKNICKDYKVTIDEVLENIDQKYLECMEGFEKYI